MANGGRDLIKGLNDLADQLDEVAKGAGTTPQQEGLDMVRQDPSPAPPYALPPYVFVTMGFDIIDKQFDANVKADYLNRSPWGFLVHEVLRPIPRNTPIEQLAFVGPDRGMNAARLARKAVDVRIALEEQVDFPNNLDRKQRVRVKFLDPTGEKTARARERQAGNIAAQEQAAEAHVIEFERIRKEVVALVTAENALDDIAASDSDLFTFLYSAMTERAEASDEIFTHSDLKDLWSFILDELVLPFGGLKVIIVLGLVRAALGETGTPKGRAAEPPTLGFKGLWNALLEQMRVAGPARIDQRGFVAHNGPSPAKSPWDRLVVATRDLKREIQDANIAFGQRVGGIQVPVTGFPPDKPDLADRIADATRAFGHWTGIIDDPKFAPDEQSLSVTLWSAILEPLKDVVDTVSRLSEIAADANRRLGKAAISAPTFMPESELEKAVRKANFSDNDIEAVNILIGALNQIKLPVGLEKDVQLRRGYQNALRGYFSELIEEFEKENIKIPSQRRAKASALAKEIFYYNQDNQRKARLKGTQVGNAIADLAGEKSPEFLKTYESIVDDILGRDEAFAKLTTRQKFELLDAKLKTEVTNRLFQALPELRVDSSALEFLRDLSDAQKILTTLAISVGVFKTITARNPSREFVNQSLQLGVDSLCGRVAAFGTGMVLERVLVRSTKRLIVPILVGLGAAWLCSYLFTKIIEDTFGENGAIWKTYPSPRTSKSPG